MEGKDLLDWRAFELELQSYALNSDARGCSFEGIATRNFH